MSGYRRAYSPPGHHSSNPRASTGTIFVTSFDTLASTQPGRSSVSNASGRTSNNIAYEAQPIRKSTYDDGKRSKTEYAVRPRQNSSIAATTETRRPLAVVTKNSPPPSASRSSFVTSPRESTAPTVIRDEPTRYLQPVSSLSPRHLENYPRKNSTSRTELEPYKGDRDRRDKSYHLRGKPGSDTQKQYYVSRPPIRPHPDEEGWSYTGPREQFDRDYPQRTAPRIESVPRSERPSAVYAQERAPVRRDVGPPPSSSRHLERIEKPDPNRHSSRSGFDSDPDRHSDAPRRRQSVRAPVLHQHNQRDDGYSSAREDHDNRVQTRPRNSRYDDDLRRSDRHRDDYRDTDRDRDYRNDYDREIERERERPRDYPRKRHSEGRRKPRSRDVSPERSGGSGLKNVLAGVLGSTATAGALGILQRDSKDKDPESDGDENNDHRRRRRRHRGAENQSDAEDGNLRRKDEASRSHRHDHSSSDTPEDRAPRRRRSRQRHRNQHEQDPEDRDNLDRAPPARAPETTSRELVPLDVDRPTRDDVPAHKQDQQPEGLEARTISPGENEDDRPRRVQLVEPVREKDEAKPRGILKPPRQMPFPEDPNPIREGVAPLKDATKDGIPVNARWTKINRVLVNPEALEKYHERFEEREDYVIVLRVLSREEIEKLAEKTKEIREAREREWQRKLEDRKKHDDNHHDTDYSDLDDEDDENRPQLAIEQAPAPAAIDLRNLQQQQQQQPPVPQGVPIRSAPANGPSFENHFDGNYSQNV